jgi:predicted N-acetyltransferase YhbS
MLLARLAVDNTAKGQGLGAAMLYDALARTLQAADIAGIRAMIVHAKDDKARRFYEHFDFDPSPTDHYHLCGPMSNVDRHSMRRAEQRAKAGSHRPFHLGQKYSWGTPRLENEPVTFSPLFT